jgi:hypothetical protein
MGGSSGGYFYKRSKPSKIIKMINEEKAKNANNELDTKVNAMLNDLLSKVNNRDHDTIQQRLNSIFNALEKNIEEAIDLRYGGSVAKHTYVNGLSDIDALAVINKTELAGKSPEEVKEYFFKQIKKRYPETEIVKGKLAVTVKFQDGMELQILPALKSSQGIKIPSSREPERWSKIINPDRFAKILRFINQKMSGKLIPLIKVAKSIIADLPENRRISGYHTEALAIDTMVDYTGPKNIKSMLKHFFSTGSSKLLAPILDKTGQSTHVDDYLGATNSLSRKMAADSFSSITRKMQSADSGQLIKAWEDLVK